MQDPDWAKVLEVFYERNPSFEYTESPSEIHSFLGHDGRLEGIDLTSEIQMLKKIGALEVKETTVDLAGDGERDETMHYITLTSRGFDVAHERSLRKEQREFEEEQTNRQNELNSAVGLLTMGLLVVAGAQLLVQSIGVASLSTSVALAVGVAGLLVVGSLAFKIYNSGLLEPYETVGQA
ncbi:hypothetical protein ACH9L7_19780 (plasmid) [Haloferax sp. S1W]|uniref:hypothetical protein n=1 Tax=Haloferax TaxID=2251 RepID=UPI0037CA81A4